MSDTKKEVLQSVKATNDRHKLVVHESENNTFGMGIPLTASGTPNLYNIKSGKACYKISQIKFYNADGAKYTNDKGWLEGAYGKRMRAIEIYAEQDNLVRKTLDERFSWSEAYSKHLVFFVVQGKVYSGNNNATLYIPMSYLDSMGYEIIKTTVTEEFGMFEDTRLFTPTFQIIIEMKHTKHFANIKKAMTTELQACNTIEDLERFIKIWQSKLGVY